LQRADEFERLEGLRKTSEGQHDPNDAWTQTSDEADALFGARMGAIASGEDPEQVRLPGGPGGTIEERNIRKPAGVSEAKDDAPADSATTPSAEPAPPAQPDWAGAMQAFMAQQQQQQQAFMEGLLERVAPRAEPEPTPANPDRSVRAMLRAQAREVAGEFASDEEVERLAELARKAVWAEEMQGHDGWKDNPEAERYVAHARSSFEQERNKYSAMGGLHRELAAVKEELAELKAAPARQKEREETLGDWAQAFAPPSPDASGVTPDDMIGRRFPHVTQMARDHALGRDLVEYALGRYESSGSVYDGGQTAIQGVWGEVFALNKRLEPLVKTLKGVAPDRRDVVVEALIQSSASDPGFAAIVSRMAKGLSVTAKEPEPPANAYADTTRTPAQQRAAPAPAPAKEEAWRNVPSPSMSPRGEDATPAPVPTPEQSWNESAQETDARMAEFFERRKREILRTQAN
jgi:hypothetical protein